MKTVSRYNSKYLSELKNVITKHIKINVKDYLFLSIILVIGVMIGVVIINNSDEKSRTEISGYINSFIDTIKNKEFKVDKMELAKISIVDNLKLVLIIWIAGSTIIGIPLIYIITAYKGMCIGYTISAIITTLGTWKRFSFFICIIVFTKHYNNTYNFNVKCKCIEIV